MNKIITTKKHFGQFLKFNLLFDIIIKIIILYIICIYFSVIFEKLNKFMFGHLEKDEIKKTTTTRLWIEILVQISIITPSFFIFKELIFKLFDKFDYLNAKDSGVSAKAVVLVSGSAFFSMQTSLYKKINELKIRLN